MIINPIEIPLINMSSKKKFILSSNCLQMPHGQRISDQLNIHQHQNLDNIPISMIDKNNYYYRLHDVSIEQRASKNEDENNNFSDNNSYFSLKRLLNKQHGQCDEDSHLSQRVKDSYKEQDALIDDYERVYR